MKSTRLILMLLLLVSLALVFSACGAKDPEDTTAPTTTAPTTTLPPTTTVPPTVENPIVSASLTNAGAIKLTFRNGTTQNLGTVLPREGYSGATSEFTLDAQTGILTVTLKHASADNIANQFLEEGYETLTVRLREMGGSLEHAPVGSDSWQVLCPAANATGRKPLQMLAEHYEFGKHTPALGNGVVMNISGNDFYIRAKNWMKTGYDFVTSGLFRYSGTNNNFTVWDNYEIPQSTAEAEVFSLFTGEASPYFFKNSRDCLPATTLNGTYIGAGHGYYLISEIPQPTKKLTERDIGIVFTRASDGQKYVLVKALDTMLWFCPFDDAAMENGDFTRYAEGSDTEVLGMLKKSDVLTPDQLLDNGEASLTVQANATRVQFRVAINHVVQHVFLDGVNEIDISENGIYVGDFIDIYERYDIMYLPAILNHLTENVRFNTNESCHDDMIKESYVSYLSTFRFHKNGSFTTYQTVEINHDLKQGEWIGVMSQALEGKHLVNTTQYIYAPGSTNFGTPTAQAYRNTVYGRGGAAVRSMYHFIDAAGTMGFGVGFYPHFGAASVENRANEIPGDFFGRWQGTLKVYLYLSTSKERVAGEKVSFIGYNVPTTKLHEDFFLVDWYFVGDDVYLSLHTDKAVAETTVALPNSDYLIGRTVTVDTKTDSFTVHSSAITAEGITVSTTGAGYVTVKLSPAAN